MRGVLYWKLSNVHFVVLLDSMFFLRWLVFAPLPFLLSFLCIHSVCFGAWPCFVDILFSLLIKKKKKNWKFDEMELVNLIGR